MAKNKPATIKRQISSGGVVFRCLRNDIEIALVAVKKGSVWCLPKGAIDKNETQKQTALREVQEETGLRTEIISKIGDLSYWYFVKSQNIKYHKTVYFYLMKYIEGTTDAHDAEVDDAQWFPVDKAIEEVLYKGEKLILRKAKKMIEKIQDTGS